VELGAELVVAARRNLSAFPDVRIIQARLEECAPPHGQSFDLVFAATAWHWIEPSVRYAKAFEALRSGGHLAFWEAVHVFPEGGDPFFIDIQEVYDEIGEARPREKGWPRLGELEERGGEIDATGQFDVVDVRHFAWEQVYDAESYIELLETFSGHIAMQQWQRDRLYGEIRRRLGQRPTGTARRHWGGVLHIARRRD
jgi:SAM-dependent methyltransferase